MITRTTIGADFEGALTYGAGLNQRGAGKKAELIASSNLIDVGNPRGLAAEMQAVAGESTRCKNPVWHTSLSWAEGEHLSRAQKLQAAERYCELMGASWDAHQVAVYEHRDKKHEHIHIYFNRVPVMGGNAIGTGHNYARNLKAIKTIAQELGLTPLPTHRQSLKDHRPPVQDTRQVVRAALVEAMADPQVQSVEQLQARLAAQSIEVRLKRSATGQLVGVSFRQGEAAVTGQEVGMKAAQLRERYEPAQRQAYDQVQPPAAAQVPAQLVGQVTPPVATDGVPEPTPAGQVTPQAFQVADVPQAMLATFGWSVAQLAENGQLHKLLAGVGTDLLAVQVKVPGQAPVAFEGRFALERKENGAVELKIALPKMEAPQQAPQLAPVVPQPASAVPEQRPVAAATPAPELKPDLPKLKPREPKRGPRR